MCGVTRKKTLRTHVTRKSVARVRRKKNLITKRNMDRTKDKSGYSLPRFSLSAGLSRHARVRRVLGTCNFKHFTLRPGTKTLLCAKNGWVGLRPCSGEAVPARASHHGGDKACVRMLDELSLFLLSFLCYYLCHVRYYRTCPQKGKKTT